MKVLVTGAAGFIGSHVALYLLARGDEVVGTDNLNSYYDPALKQARLARTASFAAGSLQEKIYPEVCRADLDRSGLYRFEQIALEDREGMAALFEREQFDGVINLAAQAGVRHSLEAPFEYIDSNITGFLTVLEGCRHHKVRHLVYASSSSVYGANTNMPFSVDEPADHQVALYGATKRANELMAHSYSHLFGIPTTGLRFFTVYGPWGRPDMSPILFADAITKGRPLKVFNNGNHMRDFTYIDDIVRGVVAVLDNPAIPDPAWNGNAPAAASSAAPWRIHNIGNGTPVKLMRYIELLEECLGREAVKEYLPLQPGDVPDTKASVESLHAFTGYRPDTPIEVGVKRFVDWYRTYYN
ncbi:NAD-dependent epimerase [Kordiimonas sp.]|uniref:NAD-dependent epimerase n=1 Tax=Kordiimonas sp. TaxID=1970157 RepID=UPI003A8F8FF3